MPRYTIKSIRTEVFWHEVEADSKEEAVEKWNEGCARFIDSEPLDDEVEHVLCLGEKAQDFPCTYCGRLDCHDPQCDERLRTTE